MELRVHFECILMQFSLQNALKQTFRFSKFRFCERLVTAPKSRQSAISGLAKLICFLITNAFWIIQLFMGLVSPGMGKYGAGSSRRHDPRTSRTGTRGHGSNQLLCAFIFSKSSSLHLRISMWCL